MIGSVITDGSALRPGGPAVFLLAAIIGAVAAHETATDSV